MSIRGWMDTRLDQWCRTYERTLASCCCRVPTTLRDADQVAYAAATQAWGPMMERCQVNPYHGYVPTEVADMMSSPVRCGLCALEAAKTPTPPP